MKTPNPLLLTVLCVGMIIGALVVEGILRPASVSPPPSAGHYQIQPVGGGLFVLDTQTGEVRGFFPSAMHGTWQNNYSELGKH